MKGKPRWTRKEERRSGQSPAKEGGPSEKGPEPWDDSNGSRGPQKEEEKKGSSK